MTKEQLERAQFLTRRMEETNKAIGFAEKANAAVLHTRIGIPDEDKTLTLEMSRGLRAALLDYLCREYNQLKQEFEQL